MSSVKSLMIHARELSELKKSCRALKFPTPMLKEVSVLWVTMGQPGLRVAGGFEISEITSTEGESAATAPVPLGIAAISVGLVADSMGVTSPWLQVERTSIWLGLVPVM